MQEHRQLAPLEEDHCSRPFGRAAVSCSDSLLDQSAAKARVNKPLLDLSNCFLTVLVRYADAFPVNSGLFNSLTPNPDGGATYAPIPANTMIDVGAAYRLPIGQNVTWSLNVTDLLDTRVATFVGVPQIGRLIVTRVRYSF